MKPSKREELARKLAGMDQNERNRIYKRAARLRSSSRSRPARRQRRKDRWEDEPELARIKRRAGSLHDWALEILAREDREQGVLAEGAENAPAGIVVAVGRDSLHVHIDGETRAFGYPERAGPRQSIAVGDRVRASARSGHPVLSEVLPRRTWLSRPDPHNARRERVLVANVDRVVVVAALRAPPLKPGILDRFLIAIERGGAKPVLCINKLDLLASETEREQELAKLQPYVELGVPIVPCSATLGTGIDALRAELAGQLCAFAGHSGVGKSSLLNRLAPQLQLRTGEVRAFDGKGRHTTTRATLHEIGSGTRIIDTPGIRSFGMWRLEAGELRACFPEFAVFARGCRYRDCAHSHEPGCAVQAAASQGHLPHARWLAYLRILDSLC